MMRPVTYHSNDLGQEQVYLTDNIPTIKIPVTQTCTYKVLAPPLFAILRQYLGLLEFCVD